MSSTNSLSGNGSTSFSGSNVSNNFDGNDSGQVGSGRPSKDDASVSSAASGGDEDEDDALMSSALQSIAQALTQMQGAMRAMSNKMEKTDDCIRCVAQRLQLHGQTVERLSTRMCGLENKGAPAGSGRCRARAAPTSVGVCPPPSLCLRAPPGPAPSCGPAAAAAEPCCDDRAAFLGRHLLRAAQNGCPGKVKKLLAAGADVNFCYGSKWTPLHVAAAKGRARIVSMLLRHCAKVDARNCYGFSPLHIAAYHDFSGRCAALLLAAGADVDARNRSGRTPLHYAAEAGNVQAARVLRFAGASMCAVDDEGHTAYDVANTVCVRRLLRPCSRGLRLPPRRPEPCRALAAAAASLLQHGKLCRK